jgi:hypothetical protein
MLAIIGDCRAHGSDTETSAAAAAVVEGADVVLVSVAVSPLEQATDPTSSAPAITPAPTR